MKHGTWLARVRAVGIMKRRRRTRQTAGYTLAEMMIVVSIIGILTAVALPAFSGYLRRTRLDGTRNQLISDIYYARSLAIAQRKTFLIRFQNAAPPGVTFAASANPNFYAWGLSDASDITLAGGSTGDRVVNVLPTGSVDHGY
jgi:prepilin-type N-terminal cleavage/methylation domain-containing protein